MPVSVPSVVSGGLSVGGANLFNKFQEGCVVENTDTASLVSVDE